MKCCFVVFVALYVVSSCAVTAIKARGSDDNLPAEGQLPLKFAEHDNADELPDLVVDDSDDEADSVPATPRERYSEQYF